MSAQLARSEPRRIKATHRRRRRIASGQSVQRYYDPAIGRLLSRDPATSEFNRYDYAANNPYRFTDPDGRKPKGAGDGTREPDQNDKREKPKGCGVTRDCVRLENGKWVPVPSRQTALKMIDKALQTYAPSTNGAEVRYDPGLAADGQPNGANSLTVGPSAFRYLGRLASTIEHEGVHINQIDENRLFSPQSGYFSANEAEAWGHEMHTTGRFNLSQPDIEEVNDTFHYHYDNLPASIKDIVDENIQGHLP